jgi:hypothetical protein
MMHALGNVNLDGHVDSSDITAMEATLTDLNAYQSAHSCDDEIMKMIFDVDHDGLITNADAQALIGYLENGNGY